MLDLSIIIVSWNRKDLLLQSLESLAMQVPAQLLETILVDNASTDGSLEALRKLFPCVKVISNKENVGFAKANNIGISQCSGKYICLMNSDVKLLDGSIEKMYSYMEKNSSIGILGPKIIGSDSKLQPSCKGFPSVWNTFWRALGLDSLFPKSRFFGGYLMPYFNYDCITRVDILSACFWMVRREALEQVGLLDESFFMYAEDKDLCKRFWNAGWEVVYYPEAEVIHYGGGSSSLQPVRFFLELNKANLQYWEKHHGKKGALVYMHLILLHHSVRLFQALFCSVFDPSKRRLSILKLKCSTAGIRWVMNQLTLARYLPQKNQLDSVSSRFPQE